MTSGIKLSQEQLRKLLDMIHTVNTELDHVQIKDKGEDRKIKNAPRTDGGGGSHSFEVKTAILKNTSEKMLSQQGKLEQMADEIASVRENLKVN